MITKIKNKNQLQFLIERHGSDSEIARSLGISRQAVQGFRRRYGVSHYYNKKRLRNHEIKELYKEGYTVIDIAKSMKLSRTQIYNILKKEVRKNDAEN